MPATEGRDWAGTGETGPPRPLSFRDVAGLASVRVEESGTELRGRLSLSAATWVTGLLAAAVLVSDLVVVALWLLRGRPAGPLYLSAAAILLLVTLVVAGTVALAAAGVRRQWYVVGPTGITIRGRLHVPWSDIVEVERMYRDEPRQRTLAIAVHRVPTGSNATSIADEPLYLDLTDVPGGAVRFFALVRRYAPATVRSRWPTARGPAASAAPESPTRRAPGAG